MEKADNNGLFTPKIEPKQIPEKMSESEGKNTVDIAVSKCHETHIFETVRQNKPELDS